MIEVAFALAVTGVAAFHDLRTKTLPDWLTLGAAAVGGVVHVAAAAIQGARGVDLAAAVAGSALGAVACAVIPLLLVRKNAMGRGDLKLFIALGAALGPAMGFEAQLYALFAAFVAAPIFAWRTGRLRTAFASAWTIFKGRNQQQGNAAAPESAWMPFAPAILVGVLVVAAMGGDA